MKLYLFLEACFVLNIEFLNQAYELCFKNEYLFIQEVPNRFLPFSDYHSLTQRVYIIKIQDCKI